MGAKHWSGLLSAALLASVLAVPSVGASGRAEPAWGGCPFAVGDSGAECTVVAVPLDYRRPGGRMIDVHVSRVPARNPAVRQGVLVTSTGGPAAHLSDAVRLTGRLPAAVLDRYDVVSFDQRGFGRSAPVRCSLRPEQQYGIPWPLGSDAAMNARARQIAGQCAEHAGAVLPYLGTANVARDVDRIRQVLGADRVSFLGISYGTYLGTVYDAMFPGRVEAMLLDSTVDAARAWRGVWRASLTGGVEGRLPDFLDFAVAARERYRLGATAVEVRATILDLIGRADLATPAGRITGTEVRIALFGAMYNDGAFPLLAGLLAAVRDGDASTAAALSSELQVWYDDDNTASAQLGVFCADGTFPRSPAVYAREAAADAAEYPVTGGAGAAIWPCAYWASDPIDPPATVSSRGRDNILLINAVRDPATTLAGARNLQRAFGGRARLVSVEHGGHGVYLAAGNACADRIGTDFLVTGRRPAADLTCPAEHAGLRGELEHLTTVDGTPGALAEVRDAHGTTVLSSGTADVRTGVPPRARDRVRIFSNTKAFVATVVLQLVAEGRVELDAPVERYLPGLVRGNGNDGREISVRQLLQHTGGLPDFDSTVFEPGRYYADRLDHHTPEELVRAGTSKRRLSVPGREFHYSTTNYVVAGLLVERVTGHPYAQEIRARILRPLGLADTSVPGDDPRIHGPHLHGYAHLDGDSHLDGDAHLNGDARISDTGRRVDATALNPSLVWAGGAMVSTVSDLNTFFTALLGGKLLPAAQLAAMTTTVPENLIPGGGYGLGLLRVPLSCGGEYWGHGGDGLGYQTRGGVTTDGRAVSLVHTTAPSTSQQWADGLKAVDTALCEAVPAAR
jgi:CubicO group peptidase (beta-lactamase class C family)/pimeloyl-ACP methyl ester carboxylesterase